MNRSEPLPLSLDSRKAVLRALWLLTAIGVVALVLNATPLRYQMLQRDLGGYEAGLQALGLSLSFFATYFTAWELAVVVASLLVAGLIVWKRADDWFALLVAISLTLFGLLPPLLDGVTFFYPQWAIPISALRMAEMGCLMAVFCLFPSGRFAPRWTSWLLLFWLLFAFAVQVMNPTVMANTAVLPATGQPEDAFWLLLGVGWFTVALIGQVIRYRQHTTATEKQQMKLVLLGFIVVVMVSLISALLMAGWPDLNNTPPFRARFTLVMGALYLLSAIAVPVDIALSMLVARLWDVDILINRALVYGGLTALVTSVYALIVGGLSLAFQAQNNLLLSLLATGLIAVFFQPVRERLQQGANRLLYGDRDDPYRVLSRLGRQLQETAVPGHLLPAITQTISQALKLPYVAVALNSAAGERRLAAATGQPSPITKEWPLLYQGELVGWLIVAPRSPQESFTDRERQLLADIAGQAGAAAYSDRLTTALQRSRERLVLAGEEERRRIRRDLHDGLGPTLASQTFKLDTALELLETDPDAAANLLHSLKSQNQSLIADIRRLVYALRPPSLDELGLLVALQVHISQMSLGNNGLKVTVAAAPDPLPPLPAAVEVAAYRIVLEALTNVVRHARANQCQVSLEHTTDHLIITISDDGRGLPPETQPGVGLISMRERTEELGGRFTITANPTSGTHITAVLPLFPTQMGSITEDLP